MFLGDPIKLGFNMAAGARPSSSLTLLLGDLCLHMASWMMCVEVDADPSGAHEIGRASCRERV